MADYDPIAKYSAEYFKRLYGGGGYYKTTPPEEKRVVRATTRGGRTGRRTERDYSTPNYDDYYNRYKYNTYYNRPLTTGIDAQAGLAARKRTHVINQGETPLSIANKYGVSPEELTRVNAIYDYTPGAVINIPDSEQKFLGGMLDTMGSRFEKFMVDLFGERMLGAQGELLKNQNAMVNTMSGSNQIQTLAKKWDLPLYTVDQDRQSGASYFGTPAPYPGEFFRPEDIRNSPSGGSYGSTQFSGDFLSARELHDYIGAFNAGERPSVVSGLMARTLQLNPQDLAALGYEQHGDFWYALEPVEELGLQSPEDASGYNDYGYGGNLEQYGYYGGRGGGGGGWGGWGGGGGGGAYTPYSIDQWGTMPQSQATGVYNPESPGYVHWRL